MNLNFFYWIPIFLFGSIYLIKLSKSIYKVDFNQKGKNSGAIRGKIKDHFYVIDEFKGNWNPELQADISISGYIVNFLIPKAITSYTLFGPYTSTSSGSLIHFVHCSLFP